MAETRYTDEDKVPLTVRLGVKNSWVLEIYEDDGETSKDVSGYTYICHLRDKPGGVLLASLDVDMSNAANGLVGFTLPKADTENIGVKHGVYDVLKKNNSDATDVTFEFGGTVQFTPTVTEV